MKILVFAGTTEGRELVETLSEHRGLCVHSCVATEYGHMLLKEKNIHVGRMSTFEMEAFFKAEEFGAVIDATHPYATEVSSNIRKACKEKEIKYLRLLRDASINENEDVIFVESAEAAAEYLDKTSGNVLITTGSKELRKYKGVAGFSNRIFVRVLPSKEVVEDCNELGLKGKQLICMQGPFDFEMNKAMLSWLSCKYMVTKDSGKEGGAREKIEAAKALGVRSIVIGRPPEKDGMSKEEILSEIYATAGVGLDMRQKPDTRDWFPIFVNVKEKRILIVGGGMVALRRIQSLSEFSCKVVVVGKTICSQLRELKDCEENKSFDNLKIEEREFQDGDVFGFDWVIAATNEGQLNEKIGAICKNENIPVNLVTSKEQCDFFFPGIVTDGNLTIGITAQGKDHRLAKEATERIRRELSWQREK